MFTYVLRFQICHFLCAQKLHDGLEFGAQYYKPGKSPRVSILKTALEAQYDQGYLVK